MKKHLDWPLLLECLTRVEALGPDDSGLLSFGPQDPEGGIFVEHGRICWVAAQGFQSRLRDLLRSSTTSEEAFDLACERCRREGLLLGQTLVSEGLVDARDFERALRRHSAECLRHLCRPSQVIRWIPRAGRGYSATFTFRAIDSLLDVVELEHPEPRHLAETQLSSFSGPDRRGVAFVLDATSNEPLPVAEFGGGGLSAARSVGRASLALAQAQRELGAQADFSLSTMPDGASTLSWQRDKMLFALVCESRESLVEATSRHLNVRYVGS